ncbi:MAG: hypothetical protein JXA87_02575 [Thermoleophilia bacterium]|nr:hypothetical protein [Thermoleophilia bacterium]
MSSDPAAQNGQRAFQPSPEFLARQKRIDDALNLRKPDRVPVAPLMFHYYPNKREGVPNREAHYDRQRTLELWRKTIVEHDWDCAIPFGSVPGGPPLELLGSTQIRWPGHGLPDDVPFQYVESEYMRQDEYDELLANPSAFAVTKLWPRIATTLAPISGMAQTPPPPVLYFSTHYMLPDMFGNILADPGLMDMLEKLVALGKEMVQQRQDIVDYSMMMMGLGYPLLWGGITFPAFDWISDVLRGLRGTSMDMYQVPDRLLAAIEMYIPWTIDMTVGWARQTGAKGVFIPMHRGADGFMSDEQFAKFYWPCLKALFLGLIDAGLTPMPLIEGKYTSRLEYFQELPPKKIIAHWDRVDRKKAKEILGDTMCFWGNVPASILCTGTVQQVKDDVKELIDIFGDNGGLIIDGSIGIPDESRPENVYALREAVDEYGVF